MGHHITALLIANSFNARVAASLDLQVVWLTPAIPMFHIDHYYSAYWHAARRSERQLAMPSGLPGVFPSEGVLLDIVLELTGLDAPRFAIIQTDYFGGAGDQWACAFTGEKCETAEVASINAVLRFLGVVKAGRQDEFDTVGLGNHRRNPDYLEAYVERCERIGV